MNIDYEKVGEAFYRQNPNFESIAEDLLRNIPWDELHELDKQDRIESARAVIAASGLLEEVERLKKERDNWEGEAYKEKAESERRWKSMKLLAEKIDELQAKVRRVEEVVQSMDNGTPFSCYSQSTAYWKDKFTAALKGDQ